LAGPSLMSSPVQPLPAGATGLTVGGAAPATLAAAATASPAPDTATPTAAPTPKPTAKPTSKPTPRPTPKPTPRPAPTGVYGNPWGYNFLPGNYIYNPPTAFCDYFPCIASFWTSTNGYVEECVDGTFSHSGGRSGSCSHHGGNYRPLYSH
jgi:hypothetical protein